MNAGGMFAAEIGRMAGVRVPIVPFAHEYLVTQPFRERTPGEHLPTLRDPDLLIYFREEGGGLVMGGYERAVGAVGPGSGPRRRDSRRTSTGACSKRTGRASRRSPRTPRRRVPVMDQITVTKLINGPEAFTPDNEFCLGESELPGFFVAAGFCAHGLAGAGGIGKVMAEWILAGEPAMDVWEMDIRRFGPAFPLAELHAQAHEGGLRDLLRHPLPRPRAPGRAPAAGSPAPTPGTSSTAPPSARSRAGSGSTGMRATPRTATRACARAAGPACTGRRRSGPSTSPRASAPGCSTSPRSPSSRSPAPGAADFLEGVCDNRVARDVGAITYTQMLNHRGGIECDFTVTRVEEDAVLDRHGHGVRQPRPQLDPHGRRRATEPSAART